MAKQQSWKQQMYQSIANSQVQQVMQQQREQGIAQLQAEFDAWQKQQNDIAQLQAEYDSWYAQNNPQPVQSAPVQTVKAAPKQEVKQEAIPSLADFFKPTTASGKDVNKIAAISQAEEREKIQEQKAKRKEAINNTLNMLGTDDFKDMSKKGKAQGVIEQRKAENEAIEKQIAGLDTYNTNNLPQLTDDQKALEEQILNSDRYVDNAPKERWNNRFLTKQEKASAINNTTQADVDRWLSPETKLTQKEKGIARAYAAAELAKIPTNASTHQPNVQTEEERQHYRDMVEIMNKTNPVSSAMTGFVELPFNLVDMVGDAGRSASNQISGLGAAVTDKLGITEGATQRNNERIEAANESANAKEETFRRSIGNAQTQYPGAYTGGKIAGQVTAYALTNPVFDGIAEGAGVTNQLAKFFINQGAQNAQDLALDTAPLVKQLMSDGSMSEEDKREVFNNVVLNALGNAGIGVVQEIPNIAKYAGGKIDARRAADEAFRQNVREGADKLARLAGTEDVDNVVRNATKQADEAAQNIENIAKQMPETPIENVTGAIEGSPLNVTRATRDASTMAKVDSALKVISQPIDDLEASGAMKNITDAKALQKWEDLKKAHEDYINAFIADDMSYESLNTARKAMEAKRKAFARAMENVDPRIAKTFNNSQYGKSIGQAMYAQLGSEKTPQQIEDSLRAIYQAEGRTDAEIDDILKEFGTDNLYDMGRSSETLADDLLNRYTLDGSSNPITREEFEAGQKRLDDLVNGNRVMAEDTGITRNVQEPIESYKLEEELPPARTAGPENVPPESKDYVSQFRTHNEHRFNLTDEELNNKYFSTDNENFHFMKGDRGADLNNATANLEADYDGTVNKILNKSTDTQFTPQEVDEGFMAWNKELGAARETGDYSKSADIMYRLTRDAHDKGAGLQAYAAWKKNTPAGVVLDATTQARKMAEDQFGKAYVKTLDELTDNIESICKSGDTLETKIKKLDDLMKEAQSKGYKNGVSGAEQMKELLASGSDISVSNIHDILYEANKVPNLSVASQQQIADIASQMYGKELTSAEKRRYINEINMILSKEKHWSVKDKAIEISHILMLSGSKTHIKNFVANVGMLPQEALARKISAIGQNAYKHLVDPNYKPTQAFKVSKEAKALAEESYVAKGGADAIAEGLADKFTNQIADQIGANYMFGVGKENILSKANRAATNAIPGLKKAEDAAGNLTNKLLAKMGSEGAYDAMDANASLLENYRQFIYGSLSGLEDNPFVKQNYVNRLASYIQAQGFKSLDDIPEEAFDIARAEALKATFKDDNTITELFKKIKNLPVVGELVFPFVKTPANLLARSIDFSPIGLARSLYGAVNKNSRFAKDTIGEVFDEVAKGLGGTGTMALGMWLYANGLITGKKSDDAELANYMSNEGWQEYSISSKGVADFINSKLGTDVDLADNYYDFSFMQPSTTNLIAAEEVWDELMDGKKLTEKDMDSIFNRVKSIAGSYTDALLAQSTMQNVADLFGSQYTDDGVGGNLIQSALEWPTRFTSGALSDMAKLGDDTKREYYSKNKPLETVKNAVASKVPGLSKTLPAKYDVFGEEMTRNKTEGQKWFNTLLNPTSTTQRNDNPLYNYVDSINSQSTSGDYIPDKTLRKIKLNDETEYSLDNKEYSEASRIAGEVRSSFLKDTKSNGLFKSLSADDKANILNNLEKVAVSTAYTSINENARVSEETQKYMDMYKEGGVDAVVKDYVGKQIVKDTGISSGSNAADAIKEAVAKGNMAEAQRLAKTEKDYLAACEKAGIEKRSEATRKIYEDEGVKGLQQYAKDAKTFESHGVEFNETTRGIYKDYGEKGLDEYKALADSGLKNKKPMTIYQSAKKDVSKSELPTLEKYAETYKKIDTGSNGEIDQKEFIAYALSQGWGQSQIETQAKIYGDWKTIPVLENGKITFKKKKK